MKFSVSRESLLKPLQDVAGVVERRQTKPILANVLLVLRDGVLSVTGTDNEVQLLSRIRLVGDHEPGETTIPARKLLDICKSLDTGADLTFSLDGQRMVVKAGRSRYQLSTLAADGFPQMASHNDDAQFSLPQTALKKLIEATSFAMAQQDVRFYLNGLFIELGGEGTLKAVATDGHRLALCQSDEKIEGGLTERSVIIPRKGVMELSRLFGAGEEDLTILLGQSHIQVFTKDVVFTSKLVDGRFPDYDRVIPKGGDKVAVGDREEMKQAFHRASILCNEKYRGVRVLLTQGSMKITASNPEQEEAVEDLAVDYQGPELDIGFNVGYVLDVLNTLKSDTVRLVLRDSNSSALLEEVDDSSALYVVMPMRL